MGAGSFATSEKDVLVERQSQLLEHVAEAGVHRCSVSLELVVLNVQSLSAFKVAPSEW